MIKMPHQPLSLFSTPRRCAVKSLLYAGLGIGLAVHPAPANAESHTERAERHALKLEDKQAAAQEPEIGYADAQSGGLDICPSDKWKEKEVERLPERLLALSKAVRAQYRIAHVKPTTYPKYIDLDPLLQRGLIQKNCTLRKHEKPNIDITGVFPRDAAPDDTRHYAGFQIQTRRFSERACQIFVGQPQSVGLLGYFSEIQLNGQPVRLGAPDDFYKCEKFGRNNFAFISRY